MDAYNNSKHTCYCYHSHDIVIFHFVCIKSLYYYFYPRSFRTFIQPDKCRRCTKITLFTNADVASLRLCGLSDGAQLLYNLRSQICDPGRLLLLPYPAKTRIWFSLKHNTACIKNILDIFSSWEIGLQS